MFTLSPVKSPRWFEFRKQVSRFLVYLARKIEPNSSYAYTKYFEETMKAHLDAMTYGTGVLKVEHVPLSKMNKDDAV